MSLKLQHRVTECVKNMSRIIGFFEVSLIDSSEQESNNGLVQVLVEATFE